MQESSKSRQAQKSNRDGSNKGNKRVYLRWNHPKNLELRNQLLKLCALKGLSFKDFGLTKQQWYYLSWGIREVPNDLKIKIADILMVDSREIWPDKEEA